MTLPPLKLPVVVRWVIAVLGMGAAAWAQLVHVDPVRGDDAGEGGAPATAVRSLARAQILAREHAAAMRADVEVRLADGVFELVTPLTLTAADSGRNGFRTLYRAAEGARPILSGGVRLRDWTLHDPARNIWRHSVGHRFRELYVDGRIAVRARAPNLAQAATRGPYFRTLESPEGSFGYRVNWSDVAPLGDLTGSEMVVMSHWYHSRVFIKSVTRSGRDALLSLEAAKPERAFQKLGDFYLYNSYHLEGLVSFLDAPGEWFLDEPAQTVYYIPAGRWPPAESEIFAGRLQTVVLVQGTPAEPVRHLVLEGLAVAHTDWHPFTDNMLVATQALQPLPLSVTSGHSHPPPAAINLRYADHVAVRNCRVVAVAANGVQFERRVKHSRIEGCTITQVGGNAITLDAFARIDPAPADKTEHNVVCDNRLSQFGRTYNGAGILASFVADTVIEHNEIVDGPYLGIQLGNQSLRRPAAGMRGNIIRANLIRRVMRLYCDGGAVYTLGPQPDSIITRNYIDDIRRSPWAGSRPVAGIYLDNDSEHFQVIDNVLINVGTPLFLNLNRGTKNCLLRGNDNVPEEAIMRAAGPRDRENRL